MDIANLIESFADFAKQKNIDRPTMIRILEDVFRTMIVSSELVLHILLSHVGAKLT